MPDSHVWQRKHMVPHVPGWLPNPSPNQRKPVGLSISLAITLLKFLVWKSVWALISFCLVLPEVVSVSFPFRCPAATCEIKLSFACLLKDALLMASQNPLFIFVYRSFIRSMICKYFLPFCRLPFYFLDGVLWNKDFVFWCSAIYQFFSFVIYFICWCYIWKIIDKLRVTNIYAFF